MNRMCEVLVLTGIAGVLTLGLVSAEARDAKVRSPSPIVSAEAVAVASTDRAEVGQAAAEQIVQTSACGRKVKVVYAGYGEGDRAGCPTPTR